MTGAPSPVKTSQGPDLFSGKACCVPINEAARPGELVIGLAGSPNVGKSTLFNALTGAQVRVGNWPGTTVETSRGHWAPVPERGMCNLVDLPGTYSLDPLTPDEEFTRELVTLPPGPDLVVVVVDAAHLARSLYLAVQFRELALRVVVALSMSDVAHDYGLEISAPALSKVLGCPVVPVDPRRRTGLDDLGDAVHKSLDGPVPAPRIRSCCLAAPPSPDEDADLGLAVEDERFTMVENAVAVATTKVHDVGATRSDRVDAIVTHPVWGSIVLLVVMWAVFELTTTVASPLQDSLADLFTGPVAGWGHGLLGLVGLSDTWVDGLLVNGLIGGVGTVLSFAPLMAIMFMLLALLEDSGYLARAAVVTDRLMRSIGLPGQAFLPLVVGFGCNVPAIAATRVLPQRKHRVLTALLVPFTSCTARLTVYMLLASVFFGRWAGTVVFAMYLASILFVVLAGLVLRRTLWRAMGDEPLVLDLPPYQRPSLRVTLSITWERLKGFLKLAGGIIVITVCLVWLLQAIPVVPGAGAFGEIDLGDSLYAAVAKGIAPLVAPLGLGAWQIVSALVVGFVAKEAVISSWAQTFAVADPTGGGSVDGLAAALQNVFAMTSGGHELVAVIAFLVFVLAYTPCVATLAAQNREIGVRWTLFGVAMQLVVAWLAAFAVFQIGRLIW